MVVEHASGNVPKAIAAILACSLMMPASAPASDAVPASDAAGASDTARASGAPAAAGASVDLSSGEYRATDYSGNEVAGGTYYASNVPVSPVSRLSGPSGELPEGSYIVKYVNNEGAPAGMSGDSPRIGTAAAFVRGVEANGCTGSFCVMFHMRRYNLASDDDVVVGGLAQQHIAGGGQAQPKPVIKTTAGDVLVEGEDYSLVYDGNNRVGKATVTISAIDSASSRCAGERTLTFSIGDGVDVSAATVSELGDFEYTGKAVTPEPEVRLAGKVLSKGIDYTLSYRDNIEVGKATLTITGLGKYGGSKELEFDIVDPGTAGGGSDLSKAAKIAEIPDQTFSGSELKPGVTVSVAGEKLKNGADYTVSYSNNVNAGTAKVVVKGKGAYKGERKATFKIKPADMSNVNIAPLDACDFTGKEVVPSLDGKLTFKGKPLDGKCYTATFSNNTGVGTGKVRIVGKGNFSGERTAEFAIGACDISKATATAKSVYTDGLLDGKKGSLSKLSIPVTVKMGDKKLAEKTDYKVSFEKKKDGKFVAVKLKNLKLPGTYYALVTGKGNYRGTKRAKFQLVNIGDDLARYACSISYSRHVTWGGGYYGTKAYEKSGARRGCHSAMYGAYKGSGYWKAFKPSNYDAGSGYNSDKTRWRKIGNFVPGSRTTSTGVKMLPGDTLCGCHGGGYHTCMYVGKKIPKEIYEKKLKGKEGDVGKPRDDSDIVSASYHEISSACYCNGSTSFANYYGSDMSVYRLIKPDKKKYRVGAVVK